MKFALKGKLFESKDFRKLPNNVPSGTDPSGRLRAILGWPKVRLLRISFFFFFWQYLSGGRGWRLLPAALRLCPAGTRKSDNLYPAANIIEK